MLYALPVATLPIYLGFGLAPMYAGYISWGRVAWLQHRQAEADEDNAMDPYYNSFTSDSAMRIPARTPNSLILTATDPMY